MFGGFESTIRRLQIDSSIMKTCLYLDIGPTPVSSSVLLLSPFFKNEFVTLTVIAAIRLAAQAQHSSTKKLYDAKLRMLELYHNFFQKYSDENKFEKLELDTDFLYLALAEASLEDCIFPEKKAQIHRNDCRDEFIADAKSSLQSFR